MYCRTCGNKLHENAEVCVNCGCNPLAGKSYCQNCGAKTIEQQELCTQCGVRLEFAAPGEANHAKNVDKAISGLGIGIIILLIVVAIAFPPLFILWLIVGGILSIYDKNKKKGQINSKK